MNKPYDIEMYKSGIDPYDVIQFPESQTGIVIRKVVSGTTETLTVYSIKLSKWRLINAIKIIWIKVLVFFNWI